LQDITAHVDFTAIAEAAIDHGAHFLGYTSQAHFLLNNGVMDLLKEVSPEDVKAYARFPHNCKNSPARQRWANCSR